MRDSHVAAAPSCVIQWFRVGTKPFILHCTAVHPYDKGNRPSNSSDIIVKKTRADND